MRKTARLFALVLLLGFIGMQFFQPEKNVEEISRNHFFKQEQVPENIKAIFKNACLDCHSNQTRYSWYHNIAPVSWAVNDHVTNGKKDMNLSEWGTLDVFDKIATLEEICQETERKTMPLKSYKLLHPKAKLSNEQTSELCAWTTKLSEELLAKAIEK